MFDYYYRGPSEEEEVIIQATSSDNPISIRVTEDDGTTALVNLPVTEIDGLIAGLQALKAKLKVAT